MRVTLVHPDYNIPEHLKDLAMPGIPLGLGYVAACAEQAGHNVTVIDAYGENLTRQQTIERILASAPDVTGISCVTAAVSFARDIATAVRDSCKLLVFGGIHPTFVPESVLDVCDIVVRGEGEEAFPEVLSGKSLSEISGISFWQDGRIIHNSDRHLIRDLNRLPWPARHLFNLDLAHYKLFRRLPFATVISGRGCPMRCLFCQNGEIYNSYRSRDVGDVVNEVEMLYNRYRVRLIAFVDEDGLIDKQRMRAMCDEILRRKLKFHWGVDARVDRIDDLDLLRLMARAGCGFFFHGVESANQETLSNMNKGLDPTATRRAFALARQAGIRSVASSILGFPGEDRPSAEATVQFLKQLDASYAFFGLATPFPGTRFATYCEKNGWIQERDWDQYTVMNPIIQWGDLTIEEQREMIDAAYQSFYGRPGYWLRRMIFELPKLDWSILHAFAAWSIESFLNTRNWGHKNGTSL